MNTSQSRPVRTPIRRSWGEGRWLLPRSAKTGLVIEDHFLKTGDGYDLFVKRTYNPDHRLRGALLLMHGSWENGNLWRLHLNDGSILAPDDMDRTDCFANWFASRGFDVFIPHLWGRRVYSRYVERKYPDSRFRCVSQRNVSFDEIVAKDIPPILDYITRFSGNRRVYWIGHSFGGMLAYAYLASHLEEQRIAAAATLGSPVKLGGRSQPALGLIGISSRFFNLLGLMERNPFHIINGKLDGLSRLAANTLAWAAPISVFNGALYEHRNTNPAVIDPFLRKVAEPVPPKMVDFFIHMIRTGSFTSLPGYDNGSERNYGLAMGCIKTPFMVFAGRKDMVAVLSGVKSGYQALFGSPGSRFAVLEKAGHIDLAVGKTVPQTMQEIFGFFSGIGA